jgi:hypothetical protein
LSAQRIRRKQTTEASIYLDELTELFTIIICSSYIYNQEDEPAGHVPSQSSAAETSKLDQSKRTYNHYNPHHPKY